MSFFQALILGIIQGITEFFPVSSSAHLRLFKKLMHIPDGEHLLYFDLLCHTGTLLALIIYLRKEIFQVLTSPRNIFTFFIALLPLIPAYFLLKPIRIALSDPSYLGYFLLLTSALLFAASLPFKTRPPKTKLLSISALSAEDDDFCADFDFGETCQKARLMHQMRFKEKSTIHALLIGIAQSFALIPGISRSGSTIAVARFCGWSLKQGALFSFLLAIPTILGGEILETMKGISTSALPWTTYLVGFIASFGCGLFSCRTVFWIYERGLVRPFAWYCLIIGLFSIVWLRN